MEVEVSHAAMFFDRIHRMPKVFRPGACEPVSEDEIEHASKVLFQQRVADLYRCPM